MREQTKYRWRPALRARLQVAVPCLARFACAFVMTGASLRGTALPLGLCFLAAAGGGLYGISALLGTVLYAALLLPQPASMAQIAAAALIWAARMVFRGTAAEAHGLFMAAAAALMAALVDALLLLAGMPDMPAWPLCAARAALCFGGTLLLQRCMDRLSRGGLLTLTGLLVFSAASLRFGGFCASVFLAVLLTLCMAGSPEGLAAAAVCGIALDCAGAAIVPMTALLTLSALSAARLRTYARWLPALATAALLLAALCLAGWAGGGTFWSALPAAALSCLLPAGFDQAAARAARKERPAVLRMETAAAVLGDLGSELSAALPEPPAPDPSLIFDRAADRVCKSCAMFASCWSGACEAYEALSRAAEPMLARGAVLRDDFPVSFLSRCRRIEGLLSAINQELDGVLYRRQFRHRLAESRSLLAEQYGTFAAYLRVCAAAFSEQERPRPVCVPVVGVSTFGRRGSSISGDRGASFRTSRCLHYVLLCDGMGSGADARRESTAAVRLLRGLLTAGFAPERALQILNSVYLLRDDGAFATVDLLEIDLASAALTLYKWGSAPSYLKRGASVQKIGTAQPPPGLEGTGRAERFALSLGTGEMLVLLSDGAEGPEAERLIRDFDGRSPRELAAGIIGQGEEDDRTAVVLKLQRVSSHLKDTISCR